MSEIEEYGRTHRVAPMPPKPEDVSTICYTSGTTGVPKGVLITHRNVVGSLAGCLQTKIAAHEGTVYISYLPLAHVLERLLHAAVLQVGGRIGFFQGSVAKVLDDIKLLRPTLFTSVPRMLNKIYQKVLDSINQRGGIAKFLFYRGMDAKRANMKYGYNSHWFYDRFVFSAIKQKVGLDRVDTTISGSAPLSPTVLDFLRCVIGNIVVEGYGATETGGASLLQYIDDYSVGNVGGPTSCCDMRLEDVPEMGYLHTDSMFGDSPCMGRGELCLRGYNISPGYFRHPELTKESFDEDGFFHTGDIVVIFPNGAVKIIDRKKNFFKLQQGEYIAAEKLEIIYGQSPLVSQIFVYGDSFRSFLVAMVVAEQSGVLSWANERGLGEKSFAELCEMDELKASIKEDFARLMKENGLKGFERIVDFKVLSEPWTVENDLLTPTFKLKRVCVQKAFQSDLDNLYAAHPEQ